MEAAKILQSDLLELVFETRNRAYGAYELRKKYNKRMGMAIGITLAIILLGQCALILSRHFKSVEPLYIERVITPEYYKAKEISPPQIPKPRLAPIIATKNFNTNIVIKKDVTKDILPPMEELAKEKIGLVDRQGKNDPNGESLGAAEEKHLVIERNEDPDEIPINVQIEASVDKKQWTRYLEMQLQRYIEDALSQGMAPGQYTVQVRFLVEKDGSINDVQSLNNPGFGLKQGAEDVVRKGPKWSPGEQNGRKVRSYHTQPITFVISEQ